MIKIALVTLLVAQPVQARCYSIWHYNVPQHCGVHAIAPAPKDRSYYVEIVAAPPDTVIPMPTVEEPDSRTPEQIRDSEEHDQAVQAEINRLMTILHAEEMERQEVQTR